MSTTSEQLRQLQQDSSLSVNVRKLVCEVGLNDTSENSDWSLYITGAGTLRWEAVERALHRSSSQGSHVSDYHTAVSRLGPVCRAVHAYLSQLSPTERRSKYSPHLTWTGYGQIFEECFDLLTPSDQTDCTLSLLQATSALERALGDVFLMQGTQCPSLLRDLLATRELTEIFGSTAMSCLHVLIGPPSSLNLRNIAWHGFLSPGELEHGLRRVFAVVNNCPQRMLTAESSVLYTTFDEILSPTLQDGSTNHMSSELGDSYMEVLLDLLVHPEGPRVRDHASHGELDLKNIPAVLANHVLCVCLAFCVRYASTDFSGLSETAAHVDQVVQRYKSLFHPTALLVRRLYEMSMHACLCEPVKTIYRPRGELELVSLLRHIMDNSQTASQNIQETAKQRCELWRNRKLRSRQRENYCRMLDSAPHSWQLYKTPVCVCLCEPVKTIYRPRGELELVSLLRHIIHNSQTASQNIQETAEQRCELWRNRKLRSRQRENYCRMLDRSGSLHQAMKTF
uniref:DUF4209 domain-containing protein n=1 Tax=Branchiostoma floridae TaxID=7739 RepID=C3ZMU6_BRAFL|eukprot:XP_002590075.1 hypothetical protein BRAFLDRAFT_83345 [Branchiostoma floridae]